MKLSILSISLLSAVYAATSETEAEQNRNVVQAIAKMTSNLLLDTEKFASMNGMLLQDMVIVPGIEVKSSNQQKMEKTGWYEYVPLVKSLTKDVLMGVGEVLTVIGLGDVGRVVSGVGEFCNIPTAVSFNQTAETFFRI